MRTTSVLLGQSKTSPVLSTDAPKSIRLARSAHAHIGHLGDLRSWPRSFCPESFYVGWHLAQDGSSLVNNAAHKNHSEYRFHGPKLCSVDFPVAAKDNPFMLGGVTACTRRISKGKSNPTLGLNLE